MKEILIQLTKILDTATLLRATIHTAFYLVFAGFLRIEEFTWGQAEYTLSDFAEFHTTRRSVRLLKDRLELSLPSSKTDPYRKNIILTIIATGDIACPVASLHYLFNRFLSRPVDSLFYSSKPFTRQLVTDTLRQMFKALGYTGHYSGYSFRRGAATSAKEAGVSDSDTQLLGRWKSNSYKLYIDANPDYILKISRQQQGSRLF